MRGLVLEGGGAKGAYQAGAIKALEKKGIKFDGVAGTSTGYCLMVKRKQALHQCR